jgi:hypothetical protein
MRAHNSYRSERRNDWRKLNGVTWAEHNARDRLGPDRIGTWPATYLLRPHGRSKYMPHNGAKERGRYL